MRIPDETHYKKGETRIEDREGYVLCTTCKYCPLTHRFQIYDDGYFRCTYLKQWKKGDDILEYKCKGYRPKLCSNCRKKTKCRDYEVTPGTFCKRYKRLSATSYFGRRIIRSHNPRVLEMEAYYNERKRREYERRAMEAFSDDQGH